MHKTLPPHNPHFILSLTETQTHFLTSLTSLSLLYKDRSLSLSYAKTHLYIFFLSHIIAIYVALSISLSLIHAFSHSLSSSYSLTHCIDQQRWSSAHWKFSSPRAHVIIIETRLSGLAYLYGHRRLTVTVAGLSFSVGLSQRHYHQHCHIVQWRVYYDKTFRFVTKLTILATCDLSVSSCVTNHRVKWLAIPCTNCDTGHYID